MRPTPISDTIEFRDGVRKVTVTPPGLLEPTDAILSSYELGGETFPAMSIRMMLEPGDLDKLQNGGSVWLTFVNTIPVFSVSVEKE